MMKIKLNLEKHCIETELRFLHNRAIYQYFKSDKSRKNIEEHLELLQTAIEKFDFAMLRSKYTALAGHNKDEIFLSQKKNQPVIIINGDILDI